jgi:hypothetical protein
VVTFLDPMEPHPGNDRAVGHGVRGLGGRD